MEPGPVLLFNLAVAAVLLVAAAFARPALRASAVLAALPVGAALVLSLYVFSEDTYRRDGTSRWDAYRSPGGALGPMFVASVTVMGVCAVVLVYAGLARRPFALRLAAVAAALGSIGLLTPTIIGFGTN